MSSEVVPPVCAKCLEEQEGEEEKRNVICGHEEGIVSTTRRYILQVEREISLAETRMKEIQRLIMISVDECT